MGKKEKKRETLGESYVAIAELSPEALKATADLMEVADKRTVEILERQLLAEIADHNHTRRKLSQVQRRMDVIQARVSWLAGDAFPDETIDEIEEVIKGRPE